jgi:hypothetical protein
MTTPLFTLQTCWAESTIRLADGIMVPLADAMLAVALLPELVELVLLAGVTCEVVLELVLAAALSALALALAPSLEPPQPASAMLNAATARPCCHQPPTNR